MSDVVLGGLAVSVVVVALTLLAVWLWQAHLTRRADAAWRKRIAPWVADMEAMQSDWDAVEGDWGRR